MKKLMRIFAGLAALIITAASPIAAELPRVEVWKNPNCGCCVKWIDHMREAGFDVIAHDVASTDPIRAKLGMPDRYASCHSARVAGYVIEGHVPAGDVKRLLEERPMAKGLAVPRMPVGSPGMEGPYSEPYQTLMIGPGGAAKVFVQH